ncbi:MAG: TolC family protein [Sphaerochaetaceae bacterium]|nr:TolC family protein [Sphaerochaetaceae bacterium]
MLLDNIELEVVMPFNLLLTSILATSPASGGLELEEAIQVALENRSEILSSQMSVSSSELNELDSDLWFLPDITANGTIAASGLPDDSGTGYSSGIGINGTLPILSFQSMAGSRMASISTDISSLQLEAEKQDVIVDVVLAYLDVLYAMEVQETQALNLQMLEESYETATLNYNSGTISRYEYLQSHVALENSRPAYTAAGYSLEDAYEKLALNMGVDHASISPLDGSMEDALPFRMPCTLGMAVELMEENSPELAIAELGIRSADAAVDMADAAFTPTLSASASMAWSGVDEQFGSIDTDKWSESWNVGISLSIPIMSGLGSITGSRSARYDRLAARASLETTGMTLQQQLNQVWNSYLLAGENLRGADALILEAEEALNIAMISYESGSITRLELDNSTLALMQARNSRSKALLDLRSAEITIVRITGFAIGGKEVN